MTISTQTEAKYPVVHLMIDCETTGIQLETSGIWQIGMIPYVPGIGHLEDFTGLPWFSYTINPETYLGMGRFDPATIDWQLEYNARNWHEARNLKAMGSYGMPSALLDKSVEYIQRIQSRAETLYLWSRGSIDQLWLEDMHKRNRPGPLPWKYWQWCDLRTLTSFFGIKQPKAANAHNALEDAKAQVICLANLWKECHKYGIPMTSELREAIAQ